MTRKSITLVLTFAAFFSSLQAETLRDHCWMWGHDSGRYDGPKNEYNIPVSDPISMADACAYMGIPNVCVVSWNEPTEDYLKPFSKLQRISWVACGDKKLDQSVLLERAFRLADKLPNLIGLDLDDYFISKECESVETPKGKVKVTKSVLGHERLLAVKARAKAMKRPLDLRMVVYLGNPEMPDYAPALREMDTILLWTWTGADLAKLRENFAEFRKAAPKAKVLLGVYMWDFGGCKPLEMNFMRAQLDVAHTLYMSHEIDGFIFHCTPLVNKTPKLEAVEYARDWITRHADERR